VPVACSMRAGLGGVSRQAPIARKQAPREVWQRCVSAGGWLGPMRQWREVRAVGRMALAHASGGTDAAARGVRRLGGIATSLGSEGRPWSLGTSGRTRWCLRHKRFKCCRRREQCGNHGTAERGWQQLNHARSVCVRHVLRYLGSHSILRTGIEPPQDSVSQASNRFGGRRLAGGTRIGPMRTCGRARNRVPAPPQGACPRNGSKKQALFFMS
jgi:hypothetical protein